jgi:hypothetical protein
VVNSIGLSRDESKVVCVAHLETLPQVFEEKWKVYWETSNALSENETTQSVEDEIHLF